MKYRDENGKWQELYLPPTGDTLPIGTVVDYDGDVVPYGYEKVDDPNVYSTEEVKTNKVWIDGKPVYRKVINDTTNRAIGSYNIPHGITNLDTLVYKSVTMYQNSTIAFDGSATSALSSSENTGSYLNGADISIRTSWEIIKTIIILEYTKTTDEVV